VNLPTDLLLGSITIAGDTGGPGDSPDNPILPDNWDDGNGSPPWLFTGAPGDGAWFDPLPTDAFYFFTDGNSQFATVGLPPDPPVGSNNGSYIVRLADNTEMVVAAGGFWDFGGTPQDSFTILDIKPPVDGDDAGAFPVWLSFSPSTGSHTFTMVPLPEPSTFVLAALGLVGLIGLARRRRNG
jgi:hypothetical protein